MFFSQGSLECPQCSALPKKGKKAKTKTLHVFISKYCNLSWAAQVAQWLKREKKKKSACQCRKCRTGQEDHLEEKMATNSSILAWKIPWTEEPGGLQSMGLQSQHD